MRTFSRLLVLMTVLSLTLGACSIPSANAVFFIPALSENSPLQQSQNNIAEGIYKARSFKLNQDVKNLIVFMPSPMIRDSKSIPQNATIPVGTEIVFVNGQIYTNHGIVLHNENGDVMFSKASLPYKNAVVIRFDNLGKFSYSSTNLSTLYGKSMNGTINVIDPRNATDGVSSNLGASTIGFLIVPMTEKEYFEKKLSSPGYDLIDSYTFDIPPSLSHQLVKGFSDTRESKAILYVYGLESDRYDGAIKAVNGQLSDLQSRILNP
jgi:hypothetical protein